MWLLKDFHPLEKGLHALQDRYFIFIRKKATEKVSKVFTSSGDFVEARINLFRY